MEQPCFHLSIPAINLWLSRHWYRQVLDCRAGRCSDEALSPDLGGHQLVLQRQRDELEPPKQRIYPRHFGLNFQCAAQWDALQEGVEAADQPWQSSPKFDLQGKSLSTKASSRKTQAKTVLSSSTTAAAELSWAARGTVYQRSRLPIAVMRS